MFPFISILLAIGLFPTTSFIGRIFLSLISAKLGMTLVQLWRCLSSHGVITWTIRLLGLKNTSPGKKVSYPHFSTRSSSDSGNPSGSTIPLSGQTRLRIRSSIQGFACGISVSTQHYPPCYPKKCNFYRLIIYSLM